uniref:Uncharacterized protein n=1 Tax=Romanomermis culicivorax TaxID=13658 RepID=A0A915KTK5_ROMCU
MSEQWYIIFRNNFCIPHGKKRSATKQAKPWVGEPRSYVVEVSAIHWQNVGDVPVQLRLHLYDSNIKKFFGRSCSLPWMKSFDGTEVIYFYVPQDEHIMLIFELATVWRT